jgi:hypothetical protein
VYGFGAGIACRTVPTIEARCDAGLFDTILFFCEALARCGAYLGADASVLVEAL